MLNATKTEQTNRNRDPCNTLKTDKHKSENNRNELAWSLSGDAQTYFAKQTQTHILSYKKHWLRTPILQRTAMPHICLIRRCHNKPQNNPKNIF